MNSAGYRWRLPDDAELGFMNGVSAALRRSDMADASALPDLHRGNLLLIGSDYSGQHKTSAYEAMAFLIADWSSSVRWRAAQSIIRSVLMPDDRRFGFKHMNDGVRLQVLPRLLSAADSISGLMLVVLLHKSLGDLFSPSVDLKLLDDRLKPMASWPASTLERALRACHFVSLLLGGLSRAGQHVVWITDADDIVANEVRHRQLVALFGAVSAPYLSHDLGHMRIATTASDAGKRDVEDFVSIADLAAGAVCDTLNAYDRSQIKLANALISPIPPTLKATSRQLMNWWATGGAPLKRLALHLEPGSSSAKIRVSQMGFPTMPAPL